MKNKVYVSSQDSLFMQHLDSLCSRWGAELIELKDQQKSVDDHYLQEGVNHQEEPIKLSQYRNENYNEDSHQDSKIVSLAELEKMNIEQAIRELRGNLTEVSRELKIGRATLYRKIKQYQIDVSGSRKKKVA